MARAQMPSGLHVAIFLDHAATTPIHPEALAVMTSQLVGPGNPSSFHSSGRYARRVVEEARETVARSLNARPSEVVFTNNAARVARLRDDLVRRTCAVRAGGLVRVRQRVLG